MEQRCSICDNILSPGAAVCPFCETKVQTESTFAGGTMVMDKKFTESISASAPVVQPSAGTIVCSRCKSSYGSAYRSCPVCGLTPEPSPVGAAVDHSAAFSTVYAHEELFEHTFNDTSARDKAPEETADKKEVKVPELSDKPGIVKPPKPTKKKAAKKTEDKFEDETEGIIVRPKGVFVDNNNIPGSVVALVVVAMGAITAAVMHIAGIF